ncbi:MAG: hypothetical protein OZSIB_3356 [Candidatus Ozemobacter sibiricus]|jgi:hypothetical protein|uniref:Uncharacterized protein n=1 Tax=Candidatus Ozemobacter sibiricus TaxID=2268124 RepID=A0A367ZE13_9BACT|nr:MAG: hypothetical protein OZSIB_3356 [Candidatus Ozemobacter sibiricus]
MDHLLLTRLEALESANRRWRRACFALVLSLAAWTIMGASHPPGAELIARRLILQDHLGQTRGTWEVTPDGCRLSLFTAAGTPAFVLSGGRPVSSLEVRDGSGTPRVELVFREGEGSALWLRDARRRARFEVFEAGAGPMLTLRDAWSRKRLAMIVTEAGPGISLLDSLGKSLLGLVVASDSPSIGLTDGLGHILWMAPTR